MAHSLGCVALLRYLESTQATARIGGYLLVYGFNASLSILPQLDSFKQRDIDYQKLVRMTNHRVVVAALDDAIVPHALSETLAKALDARFISVQRGGHFLGSRP